MQREGLTRLFGDEGVIAQKTIRRFEYDWEKVRSLLSPFGKWEEVLKVDEVRLRRALGEVPASVRLAIADARTLAREYTILITSQKKIEPPGEANEQNGIEKPGGDLSIPGTIQPPAS
jgi:hypothetical protein